MKQAAPHIIHTLSCAAVLLLLSCDAKKPREYYLLKAPGDTKLNSFPTCKGTIEDVGRTWARTHGYTFTILESTSKYLHYRISGAFVPEGTTAIEFTYAVTYDQFDRPHWWKRRMPKLRLYCNGCEPGGPTPDTLTELEDELARAVECKN